MDIGKVGDKTSSTAVKAEFKKNWVHRLLELFPDLVLRSGSKPSFFDIRRPVKLMALPVIVPFKILCFIPCTFLWNYFSIGKVLHSKKGDVFLLLVELPKVIIFFSVSCILFMISVGIGLIIYLNFISIVRILFVGGIYSYFECGQAWAYIDYSGQGFCAKHPQSFSVYFLDSIFGPQKSN